MQFNNALQLFRQRYWSGLVLSLELCSKDRIRARQLTSILTQSVKAKDIDTNIIISEDYLFVIAVLTEDQCMVSKKKLKEYEERMKQAMSILNLVSEDTTTPRNIRRAAKESMDALQVNQYTPAVRASNAISILDEILQDPNMPPYTRVKLWNVMSVIEAIKD